MPLMSPLLSPPLLNYLNIAWWTLEPFFALQRATTIHLHIKLIVI